MVLLQKSTLSVESRLSEVEKTSVKKAERHEWRECPKIDMS